jgi:hypothetical protein
LHTKRGFYGEVVDKVGNDQDYTAINSEDFKIKDLSNDVDDFMSNKMV